MLIANSANTFAIKSKDIKFIKVIPAAIMGKYLIKIGFYDPDTDDVIFQGNLSEEQAKAALEGLVDKINNYEMLKG